MFKQRSGKAHTWTAVLIAVGLFFAVNLFSSQLLGSARYDLTQEKLYTLSDGAKNIARSLDEPIDLQLFYSRKSGADIPPIRSYFERVRALLGELERESEGKVNLNLLDPEPFSDAEDEAVLAGLRGAPLNNAGDKLYFGLVARNSVGEREVIPFLSEQESRFLEYEVARMLITLDRPTRVKVGLMSSLPVMGGGMALPGQPSEPAWLFVSQLRDLFDVVEVEMTATELPADLDTLLLVHPQNLSEATLFAIDQFALAGGRIVAAVDPWCEAQQPPPGMPPQQAFQMDKTSNLDKLLEAWGVDLADRRVAADRALASRVTIGGRGGAPEPIDYVLYMTLGPEQVDADSPMTANLSRVLMATPGVLSATEDATTTLQPLVSTSRESMEVELTRVQFGPDPRSLLNEFAAGDSNLTLAALVSGPIKTAFPDGPPDAEPDDPANAEDATDAESAEEASASDFLTESSSDLQALIIADTDFLADQFWTRQDALTALFGQVSKSADNVDLILNSIEMLSGEDDLISIRARGNYERPFERVQELERQAEQNFRDEAERLEQELRAHEARISELQQERDDQGSLLLTQAQIDELDAAREKQVETRKELRGVQLGLRKDIERLGSRLKLMNIVVWPLAVGIAALAFGGWRRSRRSSHSS